MLKRTFFILIVFMLFGSQGICKMKGLSEKQLQNFVSNESICYEKIVKSCDESDKPEAVKEDKNNKNKEQLESLEDIMDNRVYNPEVVPTEKNYINNPPIVVYIAIDENGQQVHNGR